MKYFSVVIIEKGKKRKEIIKAENRMSAVKEAKEKFPLAMVTKAIETAAPLEDSFEDIISGFKDSFKKKIPLVDKISAIRQIAVMTDAGIAINDTLLEVSENTDNPELKKIFAKINSDINAGKSLSESMYPYRDEFGNIALAMTDLGERTGNLSEAYVKLSEMMETIQKNGAKFKKAVRSPMITLGAMGIAFTILIMVVVPKFKGIFAEFKTELPLPTKILLNLEWAFSNYGLYIMILLVVTVNVIKFMYKNNEDAKYYIDKMMIHPKFILINKAIYLSTMHRYNLVFGELVKAGIPVSEALETAVEMVDNAVLKEKLLTVNGNIGRGMSLADSFDITGLYQNMLLQMIRAGEAGGQLDAMITKVTKYYEEQFEELIDNLSAYIEPIMGFFIAGLVLLMALGIFLPMWDIGNAVK
ncbi:MAG: type II secretion system F family protein [Sulfurovum sp.]